MNTKISVEERQRRAAASIEACLGSPLTDISESSELLIKESLDEGGSEDIEYWAKKFMAAGQALHRLALAKQAQNK